MNEILKNQSNPFRIDQDTTIGMVTLAVADLDRMVHFYQQVIGLTVLSQEANSADLGIVEKPLVQLQARPNGKQFPRATGLYHMAILLPSRQDLGHWLNHLTEKQYPLAGAGDHIVSEALYLSDPEGNGIEIYRDRPRDEWKKTENGIRMDTLPVDLESLQSDASNKDFAGLPSETTIGHIHLKVNDINTSINFYRDVMGFDLMATLPAAAFLSSGGYHHHIGANMWNSRGAPPPPPGSLGLVSYCIELPNEEARNQLLTHLGKLNYPIEQIAANQLLSDPAGNRILLATRK